MLDTSSKRSPGIGGINATATQVYHWTTMTPIMRRTLATKAAHLFPIASKKERRNWVLNFHSKGGVFASVILATKRSGVFVGRCKPHRRWEIKEHVLHVHKYHITFSAVICGRVSLRLGKDLKEEQKEEGVNGPRTAMLLTSIWFVSKWFGISDLEGRKRFGISNKFILAPTWAYSGN